MPISADTWQSLFVPFIPRPKASGLTADRSRPKHLPSGICYFRPLDEVQELRDRLKSELTSSDFGAHSEATPSARAGIIDLIEELGLWGLPEDTALVLPWCRHPDPDILIVAVQAVLNLREGAFPIQLVPLLDPDWPEAAHYAVLKLIGGIFDACEWGYRAHPDHAYWKPILAPYLASMLTYPELSRRVQALMILDCSEQAAHAPRIVPLLADRSLLHCRDWDDLVNVWRMEPAPDYEFVLTVRQLALTALCALDLRRSLKEGWLRWEDLTPQEIEEVLRNLKDFELDPKLLQPLLAHPQACVRLQAHCLQDALAMSQGCPLPEAVWAPFSASTLAPGTLDCQVCYPLTPCFPEPDLCHERPWHYYRDQVLIEARAYTQSLPTCERSLCRADASRLLAGLAGHFEERNARFPISNSFCHDLLNHANMELKKLGLRLLDGRGWPEAEDQYRDWLQSAEPELQQASFEHFARRGRPEALELAFAWLCQDEPERRARALWALRYYPGKHAQVALTACLTNPEASYDELTAAADSLLELKDTDCIGPLLEFVLEYFHKLPADWGYDSWDWCKRPLKVLGILGSPEAFPELVPELLSLFPGGVRWQPGTNSPGDALVETLQAWIRPAHRPILRDFWKHAQQMIGLDAACKSFQYSLTECLLKLASREDADLLIPYFAKHSRAVNYDLMVYLQGILQSEDIPELLALLSPENRKFWNLARICMEIIPDETRQHLLTLKASQAFYHRSRRQLEKLIQSVRAKQSEPVKATWSSDGAGG
ncbi:MAG: HEAT repeat domain-containing protein [Candidatus Sericytochromatia bacterium]